MIRILDTNALVHLCVRGLYLREGHACYVPPEIEEEFLSDAKNESWFRKNYFIRKHLDEAEYLAAYAQCLNRYNGVSFYSLKGFGDVAILAVLHNLIGAAAPTPALSLDLFPEDPIRLVTDDRALRNFVSKTFSSRVVLERSAAFAASL